MNSIVGYAIFQEKKRYESFKQTDFFKNHKDKNAFYVIETPKGCSPSIKLGKTQTSLESRLKNYYSAYGDTFYVLYVKIFSKALAGKYLSLNGTTPVKLVNNYEKEVLKTLRDNNVKPLRSKEYFAKYNDVLNAIIRTDERLKPNQNMITEVKKRSNQRLRTNPIDNPFWMGTNKK